MTVEEIYELFPNLAERRTSQGTKLSGGEQQMLAIARILRTGARLLLLDEPTEGLAPVIVQQIGAVIRRLKQKGFTILLVEQNFRFAATVADRHYVVENGRVIDMIPNDRLEAETREAAELSRGLNRNTKGGMHMKLRSLIAAAAGIGPAWRCRHRPRRMPTARPSRSAS